MSVGTTRSCRAEGQSLYRCDWRCRLVQFLLRARAELRSVAPQNHNFDLSITNRRETRGGNFWPETRKAPGAFEPLEPFDFPERLEPTYGRESHSTRNG